MSDLSQDMARRKAQLREAFDSAFALPPVQRDDGREVFLIVGAGSGRYAARLDALLGLERGRKIVPLPSPAPGLLGLAGFRGQLIPVFDLAMLLGASAAGRGSGPGVPQGEVARGPQWLVLCKGQPAVALAFGRFEGLVLVSSQDVFAGPPGERPSGLAPQTVRVGSHNLSVMDVPSLVAAATRRLAAKGVDQEI